MITKEFVLAGKAIFTIETPTEHRTYKVVHKEANGNWPETWFVYLLTGTDNESNYTYIGKLSKEGVVSTTAKSKLTAESFPLRLLNRTLVHVWTDNHEAYEQHGYQTHHEGHCGRCGRKLTVPESIKSGFGPECVKLVHKEDWNDEEWLAWKNQFSRLEAEQEAAAYLEGGA